MKKKLIFLLRAVIAISRDMFTGFLMGLCSALIMYKINPAFYRDIGLLIPLGVIAGIFKGTAKIIFISLFNVTPGYWYNYPRFRMLALWLLISAGSFLWVFGFQFRLWISEPVRLLEDNILTGVINHRLLVSVISFVLVVGLLSYFYEPSVNHRKLSDQNKLSNQNK